MKTSTKLLSMFSAFCALLFLGMTANAQSVTVVPGLTATQMAQTLVGSNVTVTNATYTGLPNASGSFNQASSTFPLSDGIILTSGNASNALGPNNSTGSSASNNTAGDADLAALVPGLQTFDAAVLEFDITSNCNTVTFDYIFASEEYPEYGCSNFNDAFAFFITGPGYTPNTNIALVPGTTTPVSINNVINSPATNCVSNPSFYVDNAGGLSVQYDGYTVVMTATATIQPCQTYHVKIVVGDVGDSALDSAIFLKGGGINCASPSLATTANITDVVCGTLGEIDLSVNSGTGPFTFSWTGPNGFTATTEDLTGLAAGSYTVDIVGSDCLSSGQATFTVGEAVDVTPPVFTNCPSDLVIEAANNACGFSVDLLANVTATDDCAVTSITTSHDSTYVFGAGTTPVTVTATDAAGNSSTCNFNVIVNAQPLVVTLTPFVYNGGVNIKCFGDNSGRVTAGASGGCAPYTFTWSSGFALPFGPPNTSTCVQLFAGTVTCTVTDAAGTSVTEVVNLVENPPIVSTTTWSPIPCYGGTSTVTVSAQAGTAPYNGLTVTTVTAGTYEYVVADANGCRAYDTLEITQPDILDATATPDPILCFGDTTTVTVAATGGTLPYTGTGPFLATAGSYMYNVTDANGCSENVNLSINEPGPLQLGISNTAIPCYGGQSAVTVTAASATEPYFGTGVTMEYAGWHTREVWDINGCSDTIGMLITQPSQMVSTITATPILCNGDSSTITVTGSGGTGAWTGTGTFIEPAGTYGYSFLDANGCTDTNSITLTEPSPLVISVTSGGILCNGETADVVVTASGGTPSYTGTGTFNLGAGTHVFTVTDANGCTISDSITLTEPAPLQGFISCPGILCNGGTADIAITAFGGTPAYSGIGVFTVGGGTDSYVVTDANGCTDTLVHTINEPAPLVVTISSTGIDCNGGTADVTVAASGGTPSYTGTGTFTVGPGTYTYIVTDANGCTDSVSITVTEPSALVASISATSIDCNGGTADITVSATGGTAPYTNTGVYTVTAGTYTYDVVDANGCTETVSITVTEPSTLVASISATSIDCNGGTADITVSATGGTAPYTNTGTFTVTAGTYDYTVTDANGCSETVSITVTEPTALVASISATSIDCNGGTADITVSATGGTAPYTNTGVYTVTSGTYTYDVVDANGCTETVSITVTEPSTLVASISATSIDCNGGTADITVSATGGTAPYTNTGVYTVAAGTYDYTVTDANGCSETVSITVTEPTALSASISATSIDCNGGTADITVSATGGTAPYTNTGVYTVTAGTYTYDVVDANGCTETVSITVTEPSALVASISATSIDCNGGTADITVSATGGTAPYTNTGVYTVTAGTYDYTVTDANGCSETVSITVTEPTALVASISATSIDCNGGTADITVSATGGTAPYTNTGVYTVTAGTYDYTVTDANGCSETVSITVTEPTALVASISATSIDCNGGTADITVSATGGTPSYTGTGTFTVTAGTYDYTVTDANGCSETVSITVTEPSALVASISATTIDCNGGTADITVSATGGTAPYTNTGVYTVTAGTYDYTVTDANGCTETVSITVTEPDALTAFISCPGILCNGGTADIAITAFGGTAPYTGIGVFTVGAGTDTYVVTDANGCTDTLVHTVNEPAPLVVTTTSTAIDCNGGTSDVTVTASGGTAPYTGEGTFTGLSAGTYTYTVTDANGCSETVTVTVTEPAPLVATATAGTIACFGGTADIVVTGTGGTAPYTGTGTFNEGAGTYTYTVTDANGCSATTTVTLTEPTELMAFVSCPVIDCNGGTADMAVFAFGGTAPYTNTGIFNVGAGTYTYVVTDANGCTDTVSHTVTEPAPIVITITSSGIDCNGGTADVTVTATGGTPSYTGTGTFTGLSAGTYTYTVTDANGCSETASITITDPAPLMASATPGTILCNGGSTDVVITATGGTAPYTGTGTVSQMAGTVTYTVTDANGCTATTTVTLTEPDALTAFISCPGILCNGGTADIGITAFGGTAPYTGTGVFTVGAGTDTYVVTDANGCTDTITHTVSEPAALVVTATSTTIDCSGGTADVTVTATGGTAPYTGDGTFTGLSAGTYSYTVTDANGCSEVVTITVTEPTTLVASASAGSILCNGGTADVTVTATGGTAPYTGTGTFNVGAGSYTYTITDANGCTATTTITLTEPSALQAFASCPAILCNGGTTNIGVTAFGGTAPYTGDIGVFNVTAGTYTYTITDANGCTATVTHTITEPAPIVATATATSIDCSGGTVDVTVAATGGTAPYTGTGTFTGLSAGTYTYTITDANGCTETVSVTVTEPSAITVSATCPSAILCNGGSTDVIVVATGGTAPYTGTGTFSQAAGTVTYTVTDANGCTGTTTVTLGEPAALVASASATTIACNGGTADVTVTATGGTAPYTGTGSFTVGGGTFNYTVTDANGCTSTVSITVTEPAALAVTASVGSLDCASLTSDVTIVATGGTAPYSGTGVISQGVGTTTYTITDANGCSATVSATVEYENFVDLTCPGDQTYACSNSQSCGSQNTGSIVSWDEPTASSFNSCDNGCGPNTQIAGFIYMGEYNGSRYYCSNTSNYSWQAANTAAINAGGHLATIQSAGENQFISSQIMANVAWIGLTDENVEGTFEWSNGENVGYTNWSGYEPNNNGPTPNSCTYCGEADYTVISASQGGWYDRYECNLNEFVMEIPCGNPITITQTAGPANGSFAAGGTSQVVTYVATDDVTGATATCSFTVTVEECTPVYCESEGSCTAYEWIDQVSLGSINNQSGNDGGYGEYTSMVAVANPGSSVSLALSPGFSGQSYTEAWRVWVDWNYDGDFYDQGELVYQGYGSSTKYGSFTVPQFATTNKPLRVRVSMRWNCYPGPCSIFNYGEVEDYTLYVPGSSAMAINGGQNGSQATAQNDINFYEDVANADEGLEIKEIYPNPVLSTDGVLNLDVRSGVETDVTVRIVDLSGKVMLMDAMHLQLGANKRVMDVTGFARGSYVIEVISGDLKETTKLVVQ